MIIYRIENAKGQGPFGGVKGIRDCLSSMRRGVSDPYDMPAPFAPSEYPHRAALEADPTVVFGWRTKAQMRRWFKPALCRELAKNGYELAVYEASEVWLSDAQATFQKASATRIRVDPLT